jgi:DNA repair protein RecN (Recombination protein N)
MPVQALRQLGETLVDIHGQMEYQSLMKRAAQRELLDQSGDYRELLESVAAQHRAWSELREQRDRAAASAQDREARLELLRYHLAELKALDLKAGELRITAERTATVAARPMASGAREILQLLREAEDMNAEQAVSRALTVSRSLSELDARFVSIAKAIDESLIALREGIESAARYEADLEADPQRQEWVEQRPRRNGGRRAQASHRTCGPRRAADGARNGVSATRYPGSIAGADREAARAAAETVPRCMHEAQRRTRCGSRQAGATNQ